VCISGADEIVSKLIFVNGIEMERIVRFFWRSFASVGDGFETVRDGQMFRSPPFEDSVTSFDVNFLDKAVPDVLIPDIVKVTTGWANVERDGLEYNDQRGALGC
jgi:hypothetical protein